MKVAKLAVVVGLSLLGKSVEGIDLKLDDDSKLALVTRLVPDALCPVLTELC